MNVLHNLFQKNETNKNGKSIVHTPISQLKGVTKQGQYYTTLKNKIYSMNSKHLDILESFQNNSGNSDFIDVVKDLMDDTSSIENELNAMKSLETKYMTALSNYANAYKSYMENIQQFVNNESSEYIGKNVRDINGAVYYINNFGEARHYGRDEWFKNAHPTCKKSSNDFTQLQYAVNSPNSPFTLGEPMKSNQPCGFEGKNVNFETNQYKVYNWSDEDKQYFKGNGSGTQQQLTRCEDSGNIFTAGNNQNYPGCGSGYCCEKIQTPNTVAYIDNNSNLRQYGNIQLDTMNPSCPKGVETINKDIYESFPFGENMSVDTLCALGNVDNEGKKKVMEYNTELLQLAEQIHTQIQTIKDKINSNNELSSSLNMQLNSQLDSFQKYFNRVQQNKSTTTNSLKTLQARYQDLKDLNTSDHSYSILWVVSSLLLLYAIFRFMRK